MNRELVLAGSAVVLLAVAAVGAIAVPGVVTEPPAEEAAASVERAGTVDVAEVTVAAGDVTSAAATLAVDTHLEHRGGPVENVTVVYRATDAESGLVAASRSLEVGTLDDGAEHAVSGGVAVPREGGYVLETIVYENGSRIESAETTVNGVGTLTPAVADTGVEFHRFDEFGGPEGAGVPAISYTVESVDDGTATLEVSTYLTNGGGDRADDLRLEVAARQSDSNVVADTATVDVGAVDPGETVTPAVEIAVPESYDYYLDAVLWKGNTIVATDRATANLGGGNLSVAPAEGDGGLEVGDFASEEPAGSEDPNRERESHDADDDGGADGTPGFGAVGALFAAIASLAAARVATNRTTAGVIDRD